MSVLSDIQSAVQGVVGKCYPMVAPEKPPIPYAVYFQVANSPEVTTDNTIPIENTRVQIDVYASTYAQVQQLSGDVRTALLNIGAVPIMAQDLYEDEVKLFRVMQDFSIWFSK
jgi:hypothetical protein